MPAFFVITGFWSKFGKPFPTFLWQNFKTLKIPAMIFGTFLAAVTMINHRTLSVSAMFRHVGLCWIDSGLWFLDALFISKMLYWFILHFWKSKKVALMACLMLFSVGFALYRYFNAFKDFGSMYHAFMMTIFLLVGHWLKSSNEKIMKFRVFLFLFAIYVMVVCSVPVIGKGVPFITNKIKLEEISLPYFFILSIFGSLIIIYLSKVINRNQLLQYIGQNSLVYYMLNTFALNITVKLFAPYMDTRLMCILLYITVLLLTCGILTLINWIVNCKYIRYALGKF